MSIDNRVAEFLTRLFLLGAFVLLALAVAEKIANLLGQTMTAVAYRPSNLALYATMSAEIIPRMSSPKWRSTYALLPISPCSSRSNAMNRIV